MQYKVEFTAIAEKDLFDIYYYIAINDSFPAADKVISKLKNICMKLSSYPLRGHIPKEIKYKNLDLFEINFGLYRIIYEIQNKTVRILFILDGRRDIQTVLRDRLLD